MFRKKQHVKKYSIETNRLTRFKLVKSGKSWLRVSLSKLFFLHLFKNQTICEQVIEEVNEDEFKNDKIGIVRGLIATGALLGGVTLTQSVVEAEEQPALEKQLNTGNILATANSAEIMGNASVEANSSTNKSIEVSVSQKADTNHSLLNSASETSENNSALIKTSEENSEVISLKESNSTSISLSESLSMSTSTSASTSASISASTSASTSALTSTSSSVPESVSNTEVTISTVKETADKTISKVISEISTSLQVIEQRLSKLTTVTTNIVDTTAKDNLETKVNNEKDFKRLSEISASIKEYVDKSIGLPNTEAAVAKVNDAVTAIEEALKNQNTDLTDVIKQAKVAEASIANVVLRESNGRRSALNGKQMKQGVGFREVAPENTNQNFETATVGYVVSKADATGYNSKANIYKEGTFLYATEGRQGNAQAPGKANIATRVLVQNIKSNVYMKATRTGQITNWEVIFNEGGEPHDNPYFYFTVPKGHTITQMDFYQKDRASGAWNRLGTDTGDNAFRNNSKQGDLRWAVGNAQNNNGSFYYNDASGVGPNGVGKGTLTSLRDFAFENPSVFYQTDKIPDTVKKSGDFAFQTIENATNNIYALHPKGSARREGYRITYTTTSDPNTKDYYMAGFRSLENSRHRNFMQMNGSPDRHYLELKNGVPSTFLKFGGLNDINDPSQLNRIANVYDRLTGQKTTLPSGEVSYSIDGR